MTLWGDVTWTVARAGGFMAFALLTLAVALGLALSLRWQRPAWPRLITNELHAFTTLLSLVFIVVHGLAVWLDPFTRFQWNEMLIPLLSHYRPLYMGLGIIALYLALAVWISTQIRPLIGFAWWRRLHGLAFGAYLLGLAHGLGNGTDTATPWALAIYGVSVLLVGSLLCLRLLTPLGPRRRTHPNLAALTVAVALAGAGLTVFGPMQPGWNAVANNGHGNGARLAPTLSQAGAVTVTLPFSAPMLGRSTQSGPDASGLMTIDVQAALSGGATGTLHLGLQGQLLQDGSIAVAAVQVSLSVGQGASVTSYQGRLPLFQGGDGGWYCEGTLLSTGSAATPVHARISVQQGEGAQVQGMVTIAPA